MNRYWIDFFQFTRNPHSHDLLLMVRGATVFKNVLSRAFGELYFSRSFPDRFGRYDWGTYIRGASEEQEANLRDVCELFQQTIFLEDDLDESFALASHTQPSAAGFLERSPVGQLVFDAKPYNLARHPGNRDKARELARLLAQFIQRHPTYRHADLLAAVPPSNACKDFDLPALLAEEVGAITCKAVITAAIQKTRPTRPMKECPTIQEKIDNLKDAFAVGPSVVGGWRVILLDDIYQSGFTLNEVGRAVKAAGAALVLGLVATKTARDLQLPEKPPEENDDIPF